jgi:hypothetical protein
MKSGDVRTRRSGHHNNQGATLPHSLDSSGQTIQPVPERRAAAWCGIDPIRERPPPLLVVATHGDKHFGHPIGLLSAIEYPRGWHRAQDLWRREPRSE